jgi:hypothetical protein
MRIVTTGLALFPTRLRGTKGSKEGIFVQHDLGRTGACNETALSTVDNAFNSSRINTTYAFQRRSWENASHN